MFALIYVFGFVITLLIYKLREAKSDAETYLRALDWAYKQLYTNQ